MHSTILLHMGMTKATMHDEYEKETTLMKKKMTMLLLAMAVSASLLAGCGNTAEPADSGNVANDETEAVDNTETECEHEWVEATCEEAKHCSVCGETEGEALPHTLTEATYQEAATCTVCGAVVGDPLKTYVEENGLKFCQDTAFVIQGVRYNTEDSSDYEVIDTDMEITGITIEDAETEGYQTVKINYTSSGYTWDDDAGHLRLSLALPGVDLCDIYSGRIMPYASTYGDMVVEYNTEIEWEGETYTIGYVKDVKRTTGEWMEDNEGCWIHLNTFEVTYIVTIPEGYDGLALYTGAITEPVLPEEIDGVVDDTEEEYIMDDWGDSSLLIRVSDVYESVNNQ